MGRFSELYQLQPDPFDAKSTNKVSVRVCLFTEVTNAKELRQMLAEGQLQCAILRAELILEPFQILAAANRAVHAEAHDKLNTKGIHSEIVFALSPTKNITESLATFGINDESANIIVAILGDVKGDKMTAVAKKIKGKPAKLAQLRTISDYELVKQVYHVKEPELNKGTVMDAIVTRIVAKDHIS